jgi:hypothetical protein
MLDVKQFSSDLIDSSLDILTVDEKLLVFKEIKIIFTRYDFDLLFPAGFPREGGLNCHSNIHGVGVGKIYFLKFNIDYFLKIIIIIIIFYLKKKNCALKMVSTIFARPPPPPPKS